MEEEGDVSEVLPVETFEQLLERTQPGLIACANAILQDLAAAQDVVQETYLALHVKRRVGIRDVDAWLKTVLVRACWKRLRAQRRRRAWTRLFGQTQPVATRPRGDAETGLPPHLETALAMLPPDQRIALVLRALEGLSVAKIGAYLGRSEGAAEQLLVRARRAMRRQLETQEA